MEFAYLLLRTISCRLSRAGEKCQVRSERIVMLFVNIGQTVTGVMIPIHISKGNIWKEQIRSYNLLNLATKYNWEHKCTKRLKY